MITTSVVTGHGRIGGASGDGHSHGRQSMNKILGFSGLAAAALLSGAAQAGEVYGGGGFPGVMLGYAQQIDGRFAVRGDIATLGRLDVRRTEEGIAYSGKLEAQRVGAFVDWFALRGGFRLTGGLTFNTYKASLSARSASGLSIGDNTYSGTSLDVTIKFPETTPYLGIGYGHHAGKGWGFVWDLGASIGKAKVTANAVGFPNNAQFNADLDRELEQLRKGVGKVQFVPQATVALSYKF
jgi:hypothetical protein